MHVSSPVFGRHHGTLRCRSVLCSCHECPAHTPSGRARPPADRLRFACLGSGRRRRDIHTAAHRGPECCAVHPAWVILLPLILHAGWPIGPSIQRLALWGVAVRSHMQLGGASCLANIFISSQHQRVRTMPAQAAAPTQHQAHAHANHHLHTVTTTLTGHAPWLVSYLCICVRVPQSGRARSGLPLQLPRAHPIHL